MARYNNRSKHSQDIYFGSDDDSRGILKPSAHPVLPIFSNNVEYFEEYWATTKGKIWKTHIGRYLDAAPMKPKGGSYRDLFSL